jgi:delta8-fatty-acid desaturase
MSQTPASSKPLNPAPTSLIMRTLHSHQYIATRILAGDVLVIYNNSLLRIPLSWLNEHPGGALAILYFVGRDASDEIDAYHGDAALTRIKKFIVGSVETGEHGWDPLVPPVMTGWVRKIGKNGQQEWFNEASAVYSTGEPQILLVHKDDTILNPPTPTMENLIPPFTNLSLKVQAEHSAAYKALHKRIVDAGLYKTPYLTGYGAEVARYLLLASISALAYSYNWLVTSAVFLGLVWHQLAFAAHDLGHMGVTHNWVLDRLLGILIADFLGGLSIGWWVNVSPSIDILNDANFAIEP